MPWAPDDATRHNKQLTTAQRKKWAQIANAVLESELKKGTDRQRAEGIAIATANKHFMEDDKMAKKKETASPASFVSEQFSVESAKIDPEGGKIFDALIFGPKEKTGPYFKGASGLYAESFFSELAEAMEGALSFPFHPQFDAKGFPQPRNAKHAIATWKGVKESETAGSPEVRGTWNLRKKHVEDYSIALESPHSFAFSIWCPTRTEIDPEFGQVITGVDTSSHWRPTADLVEAGGANKNVFESANSRPTEQTSQEDQMTKEEVQAMIDEAAKNGEHKAAEALKGELAKLDKLVAENAQLKRKQHVAEKLADAKMPEKYVTESFREMLHDMNTPEEKIEKLIADQKKLVAETIDPVTNSGGDNTNGGKEKFTMETCIEVVGARGLGQIVREMAGGEGFASDTNKDTAFARKWRDTFGGLTNIDDKSEKTSNARKLIAEQYARTGLRNIFSQMYGFTPQSMRDLMDVRGFAGETAIASTGFSALNNTVLASVIIEAHNSVPNLIADQLVTRYVTNKETENVPGFDEPSTLEDVAEAAEKPDATLANKYVTLQKITKRAKKVVVTRESVLYDQTGQLLMRANRIAQNAAIDREKALLYGISDAPSYYCYYPSGSRNSLWTSSNTVGGNALADYTDVENAITALAAQLDSNSERITDNVAQPFEILIPFSLFITANKIFRADTLFDTAANSLNIRFSNPYSGVRIFASPLLDNLAPTTWFMAGAGGFKRQYLNKVTFPLEVVPVPPSEIDAVIKDLVAGVAVMYAEKVHAIDNKRVIKNTVAATS